MIFTKLQLFRKGLKKLSASVAFHFIWYMVKGRKRPDGFFYFLTQDYSPVLRIFVK